MNYVNTKSAKEVIRSYAKNIARDNVKITTKIFSVKDVDEKKATCIALYVNGRMVASTYSGRKQTALYNLWDLRTIMNMLSAYTCAIA